MGQEVIRITDDNRHLQQELVAGRKVIKVEVAGPAKFLTVETVDEPEADEGMEVIRLEDLKRGKLDTIASETLGLDPKDYRNIGLIAEAIREEAEKQGIDLSDLV